MACRVNKKRFLLPLASLVLATACSKGSLYLGDDGADYTFAPVSKYTDESPSIGLKSVYGSNYELFYGAGKDYHELLYVSRGEGQQPEKLERFIFRQTNPLNIVDIALQAEQAFNPMRDAECFVKITANLAEKDFCEGSSTCMQFQDLQIYSETYETCGWPRMRDFIVKVEVNGNFAFVTEPGQEAWTRIEKLNIAGVSSVPLQISAADTPFTSVVAAETTDGYVVAGKLTKTDRISASYFTLPDFALADQNAEVMESAKDAVNTVVLADSLGNPYAERAASRNVLLVATPDGFYRLNDQRLWEKLALPAGLAAMPSGPDVVRLESASGIAQAAFRFIVKDSGIDKNLIVLFKEADSTLSIVDGSTLEISAGLEEWTINLINGELWFWNPVVPALAKKFVAAENKWLPVTLTIAQPGDAESLLRCQLSGAGSGFVLSTIYQKDVVPNIDRSTSLTVKRKVFRHYYYNELGEYTSNYVDTYASPEALHFQGTKMVAERVVGMGPFAEDTVMDYGYIYDFVAKKGRLFQDEFVGSTGSERLAHLGGLVVSDKALFFYGGCEQPVNRLCLSAASSARLVKFKSNVAAF